MGLHTLNQVTASVKIEGQGQADKSVERISRRPLYDDLLPYELRRKFGRCLHDR